MKPNGPYFLEGEAGKAFDTRMSASELGMTNVYLTLRSLGVDELRFTLQGSTAPEDGQWLHLLDKDGVRIYSGICRRRYLYPASVSEYTVVNVYDGLLRTPLLESGRPYVVYENQTLGSILADLLQRANALGLPIQAQANIPAFYNIPKSAHRSSTIGAALEDLAKWVPDISTRMDYTTEPPTLRFSSRTDTNPTTLDLYSRDTVAGIDLISDPDGRALYIELSYAVRNGDSDVINITQSAGDPDAEASRKLSVFLSGIERTDLLSSEALAQALYATTIAKQVATATSTTVSAESQPAALTLNWDLCLSKDSNLTAAVTAEPGFKMEPAGGYRYLYTTITWSGTPSYNTVSHNSSTLYLGNASKVPLSGWYPVRDDAFSDADLALAGARKDTGYVCGELFKGGYYTDGKNSLYSSSPTSCTSISGYTQNTATSAEQASSYFQNYFFYQVFFPVTVINKSPTVVAAAVAAAAGSNTTAMPSRADFVEAPDGLAQNYFDRQNWIPFKGTITTIPDTLTDLSLGDTINIIGDTAPADWATMATPIHTILCDLQAHTMTLTVGPPPRLDYSRLSDRLHIPQEDNYKSA